MLVLDRVVCDCCLCLVGQIFNSPPDVQNGLTDSRKSPHFVLCPDCSPKFFGFASPVFTRFEVSP